MNKIKLLIDEANSILVLGHKRPDGDAIGSALAFYKVLKNQNKNVDILFEEVPKVFDFLPDVDKIKFTSDRDKYDLVIVVDCATKERIGQDKNYFDNAKHTINIDHHISNTKYAEYNYVRGNCPACAEYLVDIFDEFKYEITVDIAKCLITAILTDTGGFQYSNVNKKTFDFAGRISGEVNIPEIYKKVLCTKTMPQFKLYKLALSRLELIDNKIAITYLLEEDFKNNNALVGDHEGIVDIGRSIEGIVVSAFIREDNGRLVVSLRSNGNFSVNDIAIKFNGGGHVNAAGFESTLSLEELKNELITIINGKM